MTNDNFFKFGESHELISYQGGDKIVIVPDGVKKIDSMAFYNRRNIQEIILPDSVREIGYCSFAGCEGLLSIRLSKNLKSVDHRAFANCKSLRKIEMFDQLMSVGENVFENCISLQEARLSEGLRFLGKNMFERCTGLEKIHIPGSVKEIGKNAFFDCISLKDVTFSEGLREIAQDAFRGCSGLRALKLPDSVRVIQNCAFDGCRMLCEINVPQHLQELGRHVFKDCRMLNETIILQFQKKNGDEDEIVINSQEKELRVGKYRFYYREDFELPCRGNQFFYEEKLCSEASFRESLTGKLTEDLMVENVWEYSDEKGKHAWLFHEDVPTFDAGDRECDSYQNLYVVNVEDELIGICIKGGYHLGSARIYKGLRGGDSRTLNILK